MAGLTWDLELLDQMTAAEAYGEELTELGKEHGHIVALSDLGNTEENEDGRRPRSFEMITHRPITGSLRNSGIHTLH